MRPRPALVAVAGVLATAGVLSGCSGLDQQGTPSQRVRTWVVDTNFPGTTRQLARDGARVATLVQRRAGTGAIHTACAAMLTDAQMGSGELPTPDPSMTMLAQDGYNFYEEAANTCYDAGATHPAQMARARSDWGRGAVVLVAALDRARQVTGTDFATTTTTRP